MRSMPLLLFVAYATLWLALPSQHVNPDALDELMVVEGSHFYIIGKHPAAEPSVWLIYQQARLFGWEGNAIRPAQIWNGSWMTLALASVYLFARRRGSSSSLAVALALLCGGTYASLHLALDPYLFYWPPALALATAALVIGASDGAVLRRLSIVIILLTGSVLFNPMMAVFAPLTAVVVTERHRDRRLRRTIEALIVTAVPLVVLALVLRTVPTADSTVGLWGHFFPQSLEYAEGGLARAILAARELVPAMSPSALLLRRLAKWTVILFIPLVILDARRFVRGGSRLRGSAWGATIVVSALFVIWWDPSQHQFWLLPIWLSILSVADREAAASVTSSSSTTYSLFRWLQPVALLTGGALFAANLLAYAIPSARLESPGKRLALEIGATFDSKDLIVYPVFQELYVDYFGHRETTGMAALFGSRRSGETTFDRLTSRFEEIQTRGGRLWLVTGTDGRPILPGFLFEQANVDFTASDFDRIRFGETRSVGGLAFREILQVTSRSGSTVPYSSAPNRPAR
jgi:hypothetical protein